MIKIAPWCRCCWLYYVFGAIIVIVVFVCCNSNNNSNKVEAFQQLGGRRSRITTSSTTSTSSIRSTFSFKSRRIQQAQQHQQFSSTSSSSSSLSDNDNEDEAAQQQQEQQEMEMAMNKIQWEQLRKYHAKGSWKGIWTTYDYMGDVLDETVGAVIMEQDQQEQHMEQEQQPDDDSQSQSQKIEHYQQIAIGAKRSDCSTCFSTFDVKTIPVATLTPSNIATKKIRCAACGMVTGPTVLRNGIMATELVLSYKDSRVRVVFQHAPVWLNNEQEQVGPPQALKLYRATVSREAIRDSPPTAESESERIQTFLDGNTDTSNDENQNLPLFYRPVKPFDWHKHWTGTAWTWGPSSGDKGWYLEKVDDQDQWHGNAPVELWNMRLPDGIFVQCPRLIDDVSTGLVRVAWLPNSDNLLRLEAGVQALQPMIDNAEIIGFAPPSLASLRCDVLQRQGDLDGEPQFIIDTRRQLEEEASAWEQVFNKDGSPKKEAAADIAVEGKEEVVEEPEVEVAAAAAAVEEDKESTTKSSDPAVKGSSSFSDKKDDNDLKAIRDVLKL